MGFNVHVQSCCDAERTQDRGVSYASALVSPHQPLKGAPTYRLPIHPRYKAQFANGMFVPVWLKMFGRATYTRLVRVTGQHVLAIYSHPYCAHDRSQLSEESGCASGTGMKYAHLQTACVETFAEAE